MSQAAHVSAIAVRAGRRSAVLDDENTAEETRGRDLDGMLREVRIDRLRRDTADLPANRRRPLRPPGGGLLRQPRQLADHLASARLRVGGGRRRLEQGFELREALRGDDEVDAFDP